MGTTQPPPDDPSPPMPAPPPTARPRAAPDEEVGLLLGQPLGTPPAAPSPADPSSSSTASSSAVAFDDGPPTALTRPPIGVSVNSMRAGTQTLIQALSAVPWDGASASSSCSSSSSSDENGSSGSDSPSEDDADARSATDEDRLPSTTGTSQRAAPRKGKGRTTRRGEQLTPPQRSADDGRPSSQSQPLEDDQPELDFPFHDNTVARKARAPGAVERGYERVVEDGEHRQAAAAVEQEKPLTPPAAAAADDDAAATPSNSGTNTTLASAAAMPPAVADDADTHAAAGALPHGPRIRDGALLNMRAGDKRSGHVAGGLSGRLEDVKHRPVRSAAVVGQDAGAPDEDSSGGSSSGRRRIARAEEAEVGEEHAALDRRISSDGSDGAGDGGQQRSSSTRAHSPANSHGNPYAGSLSASMSSSTRQRDRQTKAADADGNVARWRRRAKLAEKLRTVFELDEVEHVVKELGCWLLRSVLLQGHMYVTTGHILFYAHMPEKQENKVLKNGPLTKKSKRHLRGSKFWFVLKNGVLTWYISSADPYFPHGNVDLSSAISCEPHPADERTFRLVSRRKKYSFQADTSQSRDEWVKAIQKSMFRVQHEGENVKIAIPFETILDIDKSETIEFAESIEIKVLEGDDTGGKPHRFRRSPATASTFDSYFFACFHDIDSALGALREVVDGYHQPDRVHRRASDESPTAEGVRDTTAKGEKRRRRSQDWLLEKERKRREGGVGSTLVAHLRHPFSPNDHAVPPAEIHRRSADADDAPEPQPITHTLSEKDAAAFSPGGFSIGQQLSALRLSSDKDSDRTVVMTGGGGGGSSSKQHTYPPPPASGEASSADEGGSAGGGPGTGHWLKEKIPSLLNPLRSKTASPRPAAAHLPSPSSSAAADDGDRPTGRRVVRETIGRNDATSMSPSVSRHGLGGESWGSDADADGDDDEGGDESEASAQSNGTSAGGRASLLERSETGEQEDAAMRKSFHEVFALDKDEKLLENFPGYLFRVIPVAGKVYISTNHFCFRSSQLLTKTRMVIPINDIIALQPQKAFRFGHHGLAIIIKGHEELFMEFSSAERRDACKALLDKQADELRRHKRDPRPVDPERKEARILQDLDEGDAATGEREVARDLHGLGGSPKTRADGTLPPPVMFTSTSSSFLDFKPPKPLHITCLTIGSRGDVQPYIALCKGLQAEGHQVRIASHGEYREWIEGHGIEFGYVGGDPAELMRICVENGMFTVSFIKEGLQKFRDWIDDLLVTSWSACQGTDLLIESPSAMGGLHIAEGLGIPYFRAFTMPWTRTRAYPHAFAVPDGHRGGSYNYMTYTMFDQVFWRAISGQVNAWRKKTIGIAPTTLDKMEQHKVPFLYNFSPTVVPPPLDWYEWIRVTGYWFLDNADDSTSKKWEPPAGMLDFIDRAHADGKKVVYIGFGSIVVSDPDAMTDCVVQSVLDADVRCILSKGWSDRLSVRKFKPKNEQEQDAAAERETKDGAEGQQFPPEIFSVSSVPHDWLFNRIDAACHHGGAGTTGASLRAGIPTIIKPFFGDQFFWADRVEVLGVGSSIRKLTKDHLTEALKTATQDVKQIDKAKLLGEEIRAENGVNNAVQAIYRDLEYAKSLIKRPDQDTPSDVSPPNNSPSVPLRQLPTTSQAVTSSPTLSSSPGRGGGGGGESDESWDVVADDKPQTAVVSQSGEAGGRGKAGAGGQGSRGRNGGLGLVGTVIGGLTGGLTNGLGNKSREKKA